MFNLFRRRQSWHIAVPSLELDDVCDRILWYLYENSGTRWSANDDIRNAAFHNQTSQMFDQPFRDAISKLLNEELIDKHGPTLAHITNKGINFIAEIPLKYRNRPFYYNKKVKRQERRYERFKEILIFGNALATLALAGWQGWDSYRDKHKEAPTPVPAANSTVTTKTSIDSSTTHRDSIKKL